MSVKIENMIKDMKLQIIVKGPDGININISDINRPGLQFAGFYSYFANQRIQVIGNAEWSFLDAMQSELRKKRLKKFLEFETPCIILARNLIPHEELVENAKLYNRWVLRTEIVTSRFTSKIMNYLDEKLAPETRVHGVLVDVYGVGILIKGESGIGKSETALELIKRGHRLVADDAVDIKQVEGVLTGRAPYITSGMMEVRGMGIIDVPALYGLSSIVKQKNIDLVICIEQWDGDENYDRLGIDKNYIDILGVPVRKITLPIRPGRNTAVLIEAAAANFRYSLISKVTPVETISERINEHSQGGTDDGE